MNRIQHDLVQGSPDWQQFRLQHHGASEAAAMLGLSPHMKRTELLHMKHIGLPREFSEWVQSHVLDHGHATEAAARPRIEVMAGCDLYPVTYSLGALSASCDGLDMAEVIAMEHKQWSETLAALVQAGEMPEEHMPQCQQVMLVTGAIRCIFVVSDGTPERMVHIWVDADPEWHQRLIDGWAQFDRDLAAYSPPAAAEPAPVGKSPDTLPALRIEVTGMVTASNLAEFKQTALAAIRSVNRNLKTDADFADADKAVKWCADVEARLKAAKEHALSQTASIDELFKALDDIASESKAVRLDLAKLSERRKQEVKEAAVTAARRALNDHIAALNAELAPMRLQPVLADFTGCIKGLRSFASMQDALDTTLAAGKIAADAQGRLIRANIATFKAGAAGVEFLFSDLGQVIHKSGDDFAMLVQARVNGHKMAEAAKERQRQADEAQRIADAEKRAREQEAARIAEQQRQQAEAERQAAAALVTAEQKDIEGQNPQQVLKATPATADATDRGTAANVSPRGGAMGAGQPAAAGSAVADDPATLNLTTINARFGGRIKLDSAGLALMGIEHSGQAGAAKLYRESDIGRICRALVVMCAEVQELQAA